MRRAGAQAREVLIAAAAHQWGVDKSECRAKSGAVFHEATQQRLPYGELIATALTLPAGDLERVPLKDPKDFRFIGKAMGRVDMASKVDGSAIFGMDVRLPGMLFAVIARCPQFGGKMASFDASDAKAVPGVKAVFAVPAIGYVAAIQRSLNVVGGVAVVANSTWGGAGGSQGAEHHMGERTRRARE